MARRAFEVKAVWDDEASVWRSESDITGLHVEAETLGEFNELVREFAAELIVANHMSDSEIAGTPLRDLIPTIIIRDDRSATAAE